MRRFKSAYGALRATEGRGVGGEEELLALPYLRTGPLASQWAVRRRTFDCFVKTVLARQAVEVAPRPVKVLDLGAANGWLCYRVARQGHRAIALDIRIDTVDGLAAGKAYQTHLPQMFRRVAASFDHIPFASRQFDIVVFNASLHYALDLFAVISEAARVVMPGGRIAILDSPFYANEAMGAAMVAEKRRNARRQFGELADDLTTLPFVEYLTARRLEAASETLALSWQRQRVRYPFRYELRPWLARIKRQRAPSRFDLWAATVP